MKLSTFFLFWVFGFFLLLSFDLFIEAFVFEWLSWNGTDKNDWFFALWWGLVVVWALYGFLKLLLNLERKPIKIDEMKILLICLLSFSIFIIPENAMSATKGVQFG